MQSHAEQSLIIDGYNVIHRLSHLARMHGNLQKKRERLAAFMAEWRVRTRYKGAITIVFDGQDCMEQSFGGNILHGIRCIFSRTKEDADDRIIRILKDSSAPEHVMVVSDDNYVANHCRSFGARIKAVSFLAAKKQATKNSSRSQGGTEKKINAHEADQITNYLKKVWNIK